MKIKISIIVSIVLFVVMLIMSHYVWYEDNIILLILAYIWPLSVLWVIYEIVAQIVRSIYKAVKNRKNPQPQTPPEP